MDERRALQLALGYWPARAFSAAGELGIYRLLERDGSLDAATIGDRLGVRSRSLPDLLGALVQLNVLTRDGDRYGLAGDAPDDELLAMADAASFQAWANLPVVLREGRREGPSIYEEVAADPDRLEAFADLMARVSEPARLAVAALEFGDGETVCDVGGADGRLAITVASAHPGVACISFDLPAFAPLVEQRAHAAGLGDRVTAVAGDFFVDPLPRADTIVLSLVLLDWDEAHKRQLLRACGEALTAGGRLVIVERLDDEDKTSDGERSAFDRLRSLHFLALLGEAHRFRAADLARWLADAGCGGDGWQSLGEELSLFVARRTTE